MRFVIEISQDDLDDCMEPDNPESAALLIRNVLAAEYCTDAFEVTYLDGGERMKELIALGFRYYRQAHRAQMARIRGGFKGPNLEENYRLAGTACWRLAGALDHDSSVNAQHDQEN